ncbi:Abc transporter, partial [Globisporangium splendens]
MLRVVACVQRTAHRRNAALSSSRSAFASLATGSGGTSARRSAAANASARATVQYKNPFYNDEPPAPVEPLVAIAPSYELYPNQVHCFLGLNGSGKSRFLDQLQRAATAAARSASSSEVQRRCRVSSLSLDAHREFVALHGEKVVANVLGGVGSPSARDLIVRLGLYPVWESCVKHLSTGEMRKLMLAETLLRVPRANVLILDQPFDGLDKAARKQLEWMLGQLTRGFTRLLVETGGRNDAFAYKTQVLLVANRLEQVFPDILTHMVLMKTVGSEQSCGDKQDEASSGLENSNAWSLEMLPWNVEGQANDPELLHDQLRSFFDKESTKRVQVTPDEMVAIVKELFDCSEDEDDAAESLEQAPAVDLRQVSIAYDERRVLLDAIDFQRHRHEHWVLLGPNGSGKSSLMRVLMQVPGHGLTSGDVLINGDNIALAPEDAQSKQRRQVEAISTDQHIQLLHQSVLSDQEKETMTALELIAEHAASTEKAHLAAKLLALPLDAIRTRSLAELSQGEQKLVLIARTIATCPEVLILDEITHGLDPFNRQHVLDVVNAIGTHAKRKTHLILITHHEDEITECFTSVVEIADKQLVERPPRQ